MRKYLGIGLLCLCLLALCTCGQAEPVQTIVPTTQPPATQPIKYPASYKDAPEAYKPVLDSLYHLVHCIRNDVYDDKLWTWFDAGITVPPGLAFDEDDEFRHNSIGYAIKDINNDGVPELLIMSDLPYVLSLFTLKDNEPVHLESYEHRRLGAFAADGTIYTSIYSGAGAWDLYSHELKKGASELTELTQFYYYTHFSEPPPNNINYYQVIDGEEHDISKEKFLEIQEKYENPPNPMPLTFISIEQ